MAGTSNIIHFLSTTESNQLYFGRIEKYLQPGSVALSVYVDTGTAFAEMTASPRNKWDLLIVDSARVGTDTAAIQEFQRTQPGCKIVILGSNPALLSGAICRDNPRDLDEWLSMMHSLL